MSWYSVRIFFGPKIVAEEAVRARDETHAHRLAAYVAKTVAKSVVAPFVWDERKVSWVIYGCHATAEVA